MLMHWLNMQLGLIGQAVRETASPPNSEKVNKKNRIP
jgi:hypothetical protein